MAERLAKLGEFLFQVGQGSLERLAMVRVRCRGKLVHDAGSGQLQIRALPLTVNLLGRLGSRRSFLPWRLGLFDLGFYILTFPTTCHVYSFAQIWLNLSGESQILLQKSAASWVGGAEKSENDDTLVRRACDFDSRLLKR